MLDDPPASCRLSSAQRISFLEFISKSLYLSWGCTPLHRLRSHRCGTPMHGRWHQQWMRQEPCAPDHTQNEGLHGSNSPERCAALQQSLLWRFPTSAWLPGHPSACPLCPQHKDSCKGAAHLLRMRCSWLLGGRKPTQSHPCFAADSWKMSFRSLPDLK